MTPSVMALAVIFMENVIVKVQFTRKITFVMVAKFNMLLTERGR